MNKTITFHINQEAYTINLGKDPDNTLRASVEKYLTTEKNLSVIELLLAYLRKSEEVVNLEKHIKEELDKLPSLDDANITKE